MRTQCNTHHPFRGDGDVIGIHDTQGTLDGSHNLRAAQASNLLFHLFNLCLHLAHLIGSLGLRHTDDIHACFHHGFDVLLSIGSVERIDAYHHFRVTVVDGAQSIVY